MDIQLQEYLIKRVPELKQLFKWYNQWVTLSNNYLECSWISDVVGYVMGNVSVLPDLPSSGESINAWSGPIDCVRCGPIHVQHFFDDCCYKWPGKQKHIVGFYSPSPFSGPTAMLVSG